VNGPDPRDKNVQLLIAELTERSDSAINPVTLRLLGRNVQHEHEVGRMTGCTQSAPPRTRLVHWTAVYRALPELGRHARLEPDQRQSVVQDLGKGFVQRHLLAVPASALYEQTLKHTSNAIKKNLYVAGLL